jgi:hypothetical protein
MVPKAYSGHPKAPYPKADLPDLATLLRVLLMLLRIQSMSELDCSPTT